jgi:hypothetical protein
MRMTDRAMKKLLGTETEVQTAYEGIETDLEDSVEGWRVAVSIDNKING